MPSSFDIINYSLRPAKNVERKMIVEAIRKLTDFYAMEEYTYVGFGSTFFSDFILVHRTLGITKLISIERDVDKRLRFEFNKPFGTIQMQFGHSSSILPQLDWSGPTIVWLDYDSPLDESILTDVTFVCTEICPGSVLLVTVNSEPGRLTDDEQSRIQRFNGRLGELNVPSDVTSDADLAGWNTACVHRRIVDNRIRATLRDRNAGRTVAEIVNYQQLFNFHYSDGAKMLTAGGVFFLNSQRDAMERCRFDSLPFVSMLDEPFTIEAPNLTLKEIWYIEAQLPGESQNVEAPGVPRRIIENYMRIYRYFPRFVDAEL